MAKKNIRCALYDRVSTEEQVLYGISLAAQVEDLTRYANEHGYTIVGIYGDEGITARKNLENRKQLMRLLEDVKHDKIDLILVTKLDRWFRNVRDYHNTQAILDEHHCNWKTIYEDYDTSTADGQLKINIMLAVAQNESDRTSERIKYVLRHKVRNGEHVTGAAPYGYISLEKKLQKDPETQDIIEDIFSYYFSCFSKRRTVSYIMDKYQDREKKPTVYQINRVLSTETYAGIYQGREDYYPAYITKAQYEAIQGTSDTKTYQHTEEPYIFSGLMKCTECGAVLTGFLRKHKCKDGSVTIHKRYRCCRKFGHTSGGPCLSEEKVEDYMTLHVRVELDELINAAGNENGPRVNRIPSIQAEMARLNNMYQKGRVSEDYYEQQYTLLEKEIEEEKSRNVIDMEKYLALDKKLSGGWLEMYDKMDAAHKNAFWKQIIQEIYIDKATHKVCGFSFR